MSNKKKSSGLICLFFIVLCTLLVVPFLLVVSISLSDERDIVYLGYRLIPRIFSTEAYQYIFKNPTSVLNAYRVTAIFSFSSTVLGTLLMSMLAHMLAKRNLRGQRAISFFVYFTMLFLGGLVPTYILITRYLMLGNTMWVYILTGLISPWYVFMIRTFFQGIPYEISESAMIDGASEYGIFFKMILPLSKPVLATVALFVFLAKWNDWYTAMLYIDDENLVSLQYLLQRIMQNVQLANSDPALGIAVEDVPAETVRMAMAVVVAGPALLVFPFFQKYFVKGMTVGSVKG